MNAILQQQLSQLALTPETPPDAGQWRQLLERLGQAIEWRESQLTQRVAAAARAATELRTVLDGLPGAVALFDAEDRLLLVNASYAQMLGCAPQQAVGRSVREVEGPAVHPRMADMQAELATGADVVYERFGHGPEGEQRRYKVHSCPLPDVDGVARRNLSLLTDVTDVNDMKVAWLALVESERKLRAVLELSASWYWETDIRGRYTVVEGLSLTDADLAPALWIGHDNADVARLVGARMVAFEPELAVHQGLLGREGHFKWVFEGGRERHWHYSIEPVCDNQTRFTGFRGTMRDISQAVAAEPALARRFGSAQARPRPEPGAAPAGPLYRRMHPASGSDGPRGAIRPA